jgi:hypothetical protein
MNALWKFLGAAALVPALVVGMFIGMNLFQPASGLAQKEQGAVAARYTVVHTEGTNIIVTDNKTNTVYFYTVDPGSEPGSDLKLRGSVDLSQIGEQVIKPKLFKKQN